MTKPAFEPATTPQEREQIITLYGKLRPFPGQPSHTEACKALAKKFDLHWKTVNKIIKDGER